MNARVNILDYSNPTVLLYSIMDVATAAADTITPMRELELAPPEIAITGSVHPGSAESAPATTGVDFGPSVIVGVASCC